MLSEQAIIEIEDELKNYDRKRAASVEVLKIVQRHHGWVSDENLQDAARLLDLSPDELDNVATFYSLIFRRPVGRHVILIFNSISCWIMGYTDMRAHLSRRLGIQLGETTRDGRFTLLPVPCLGACDHAPAMMIDDDLYQDLTGEKIDQILAGYEQEV
jgi:NADH-quinone oxidoreductase subunit E